ncbi:STAS domain-containing protein [Thiorhodovibrio frisius]|uniref:Anti-sigma factor antagonist n=1 Tax=Thiorhodovibrio frisius TaxID=631362 RepID=H8Z8Q5_9GAMM|nr:STAS domain-containing protein [Thiorhodovibrio frisius]EIC19460.1 anti-anti-sigma regulatory factor (antagonist of anti-sigma factor) [Thiorhodovibrio frisius]WPL22237.1 Putative anti-sigma factor antagonist BtrV [Thiorhodovibrio frisius]
MNLNVSFKSKGDDAYIVYPVGALNSDTSQKLEQVLNEVIALEPKLVVLDLDQLGYISSAGIRVFLKAKKDLKRTEAKLSFMNLQPPVRKVFDIINALPSMDIFASLAELDEYLDAMQQMVERDETQKL